MSKKNRLKKKRKYSYTKGEFVDNICSMCGICEPGTDPKFCYGDVYLEDPKYFVKKTVKNLAEMRRWLTIIAARALA